jgi:hypothetical protein
VDIGVGKKLRVATAVNNLYYKNNKGVAWKVRSWGESPLYSSGLTLATFRWELPNPFTNFDSVENLAAIKNGTFVLFFFTNSFRISESATRMFFRGVIFGSYL